MKILKYVASLLFAVAMASTFSSCSNDQEAVDSKAKYQFEFVIEPGSLSEDAQQSIKEAIYKKVLGDNYTTFVNAVIYPLYCTEGYAIASYDSIKVGENSTLQKIIDPVADENNVLDFSLTVVLKDENDRVIRDTKTYTPNVERVDCSANIEVLEKGQAGFAGAAAMEAELKALYTNAAINCTPGYAKKTYVSGMKKQVTAILNKYAEMYSQEDFNATITVMSDGKQYATTDVEPQYDYREKMETTAGSLDTNEEANLQSKLGNALFNRASKRTIELDKATYGYTHTQAIDDYKSFIELKASTVKDTLLSMVALTNKADFSVKVSLYAVTGTTENYVVEKNTDGTYSEVTRTYKPDAGTQADFTVKILTDTTSEHTILDKDYDEQVFTPALQNLLFNGQTSLTYSSAYQAYAKGQFNALVASKNADIQKLVDAIPVGMYKSTTIVKVVTVQLVNKNGKVITQIAYKPAK